MAVVGGGVIGCAIAWELSKEGHAVVLVERGELAREASWASAGIISPPRPNQRAELAMLGFTLHNEIVPELEKRTGISTGSSRRGMIGLSLADDVAPLREHSAWQQAQGIEAVWLDRDALREKEPAIHERFEGGLFNPGASSVLLSQVARMFARAAELEGARIVEHSQVFSIEMDGATATGLHTTKGFVPAGSVVVASGAWSSMFAENLDYPIATIPVRGQIMAVAEPPIPLNAAVRHGGYYIYPRADGTIAIGATEEHESGFDARVTPQGLAELVAVIAELAPTLNQGRLSSYWAGLRPGTIDGESIIGKLPHLENVWIATGHFRSGALLATATARLLAQTIREGKQHPLLADFDPALRRTQLTALTPATI